ncbi:MAG: carbohydrate kinase [Bacillus subtilis]|nr:carbohydrate kinase [Bacillus subtilis]
MSRLGGSSAFIGQVGADAFGDFLHEVLDRENVDTTHLFSTSRAHTALAFVTLSRGEREFVFYRNPSADMLMREEQIHSIDFTDDILHFGSVALQTDSMRDAHRRLISKIQKAKGIVSFDPNLRVSLWKSADELERRVLEFLPKANIVKISDDELWFFAGKETEEQAVNFLFQGKVEVVLVTRGKAGATVYHKGERIDADGFVVESIDTTGAGDGFVAGMLYQIAECEKPLCELTREDWQRILRFSNAVGAIATTAKGAMPSYPNLATVEAFLRSRPE